MYLNAAKPLIEILSNLALWSLTYSLPTEKGHIDFSSLVCWVSQSESYNSQGF